MEKKTLLTAAFISMLLLLAVAGTHFVNFGVANPLIEESWMDPPVISIHSPINETYISNVLLNFTVAKPESWLSTPVSFGYEKGSGLAQKIESIICYVDGKFCVQVEANENVSYPLNYFEYLTNLCDGVHSLTIRVRATGVVRNWISSKVYSVPITISSVVKFTLDATSPIISVFSVENKTYDKSEVPLNFAVNEPVSQVTYSLDGQKNVTIAGNTTLANLPYGEHNVTVYATDHVGNIGSETIAFTIAEPEPFPTTIVIAPIASVAVIGAGLLVYFRKIECKNRAV